MARPLGDCISYCFFNVIISAMLTFSVYILHAGYRFSSLILNSVFHFSFFPTNSCPKIVIDKFVELFIKSFDFFHFVHKMIILVKSTVFLLQKIWWYNTVIIIIYLLFFSLIVILVYYIINKWSRVISFINPFAIGSYFLFYIRCYISCWV